MGPLLMIDFRVLSGAISRAESGEILGRFLPILPRCYMAQGGKRKRPRILGDKKRYLGIFVHL